MTALQNMLYLAPLTLLGMAIGTPTASGSELESYYEITLPETTDDALLIETILEKRAGYAALEAERAAAIDVGGPEALRAFAELGTVYEDMAYTLAFGSPPLYLNPSQVGHYRALSLERALVQCERARRVYSAVTARESDHAIAAPGMERLSVTEGGSPSREQLEREIDAQLQGWPKAAKPGTGSPPAPSSDEPSPRHFGIGGLIEGSASSEPRKDGREKLIELSSTPESQACLRAKNW